MQYDTWKDAIVRVLGDSFSPLNVVEIYDRISENKYYVHSETSGSINSVVGDMIYNGDNFSLLNSALNGAVVGAIGGFVYGSLTEVGYQAQLKYGKGNIINSDFTLQMLLQVLWKML